MVQNNTELSCLVVDDDEFIRFFLSDIVKGMGYNVVKVAAHGKDALHYVVSANSLPDLIISDRTMPEMGGLRWLTEAVQYKNGNPVGIILVSGNLPEDVEKDCKILKGIYGNGVVYLLKPFKPSDLEKAVEDIRPYLSRPYTP